MPVSLFSLERSYLKERKRRDITLLQYFNEVCVPERTPETQKYIDTHLDAINYIKCKDHIYNICIMEKIDFNFIPSVRKRPKGKKKKLDPKPRYSGSKRNEYLTDTE